MNNEVKPAPDTSGAEDTEKASPAARKMTADEYAAKLAQLETQAATETTPDPNACPDCGEVHEEGLPKLSALLGAIGMFSAGAARAEVFSGHPVEIAADIIGQLRLSPRDLVTLASALLCTVVERSHDDWGKQGNPFGHIDYDMGTPGNTPFKIGAACLNVVDSWGHTGFNPPPADPVAH